jgi:hypothetical protein
MTGHEAVAVAPEVSLRGWSAEAMRAARAALVDAVASVGARLEACEEGVWLDVADLMRMHESEAALASQLAQSARRVGLRVSVGVASNKGVAAMASRQRGGVTVVPSGEEGLYMARVPLADASCNLLASVFSPLDWQEAQRLLAPGGGLLRMGPTREHLMALRQKLYDEVRDYDDEKHLELIPPGMRLTHSETLRFTLHLDTEQARADLLAMTPHGWRASAERRAAVIAARHDPAAARDFWCADDLRIVCHNLAEAARITLPAAKPARPRWRTWPVDRREFSARWL